MNQPQRIDSGNWSVYITTLLHFLFHSKALFLRELCSFALALELQDGTKFYQRLCSYGLMPALEQMLVS